MYIMVMTKKSQRPVILLKGSMQNRLYIFTLFLFYPLRELTLPIMRYIDYLNYYSVSQRRIAFCPPIRYDLFQFPVSQSNYIYFYFFFIHKKSIDKFIRTKYDIYLIHFYKIIRIKILLTKKQYILKLMMYIIKKRYNNYYMFSQNTQMYGHTTYWDIRNQTIPYKYLLNDRQKYIMRQNNQFIMNNSYVSSPFYNNTQIIPSHPFSECSFGNIQISSQPQVNPVCPSNPPQIGPQTPAQVHKQFLAVLKDSNSYRQPQKYPPHQLVSYLIKLLSLQQCPCPLSILSYIAVEIPHFPVHFAHYQLEFFQRVLSSKYPLDVDYGREYWKICIMDSDQVTSFMDLLQIICIITCRIQEHQIQKQQNIFRYNKQHKVKEKNTYVLWIFNYLDALHQHTRSLQTIPNKSEKSEQFSKHYQAMHTNTSELISHLSHYSYFGREQKYRQKLSALIYKMLPYNKIWLLKQYEYYNEEQRDKIQIQYAQVTQLTNIYIKLCQINNFDGIKLLFQQFFNWFIKSLNRIGNKHLKFREDSLQDMQQIRNTFQFYSFKILNTLCLKHWSKAQRVTMIQILNSYKFVCGFSTFSGSRENTKQKLPNQQKQDEYQEIIELAFTISKQKTKQIQKQKKENKNRRKVFVGGLAVKQKFGLEDSQEESW